MRQAYTCFCLCRLNMDLLPTYVCSVADQQSAGHCPRHGQQWGVCPVAHRGVQRLALPGLLRSTTEAVTAAAAAAAATATTSTNAALLLLTLLPLLMQPLFCFCCCSYVTVDRDTVSSGNYSTLFIRECKGITQSKATMPLQQQQQQ